MRERAESNLGYALLGMIHQEDRSGYDLRKAFTVTPLATFSDSPGAIYPALRRLARRRWIEPVPQPANGRRRRPWRLSAAGKQAFRQWLALLPTRDEVMRDMDGLLLRFAFMSQAVPARGAARFLAALHAAIESYIVELERYLGDARPQMTLSGRLAFEAGIARYRATARWAALAERAIGAAGRDPRR